jgi:membrane-associated phospholipid phosphatase
MPPDTALLVQRAMWAGQHALALFFVSLALLWAASAAGWWLLQRHGRPAAHDGDSPIGFMALGVALGGAVFVLGAGVFLVLAGRLGAAGPLGPADQALTEALRASVPRAALPVFAALTHLGDTATLTALCIIVAVALIALHRPWLALGWVVAVAGNGGLNRTLKQVFSRMRPFDQAGAVLEQGFSFPSGHSSGSVVAYGMLAYIALRLLPPRWHLPALLAALTIAFTVGASRLFLRVHFASDVIAGFASGAAWLALCVTSIELLRRWRQQTGVGPGNPRLPKSDF